MENINMGVILTMLAALTALTNIIVQAVKKATWDKLPTNLLALIVAVVLTLAAGMAYLQIAAVRVTWYLVVGLVVVGVMVAYAAMFGYDKLKEALNWKK